MSSRKILRRKLILFSILPALVLVAIGVKLVTMVAYGHAAKSDFLEYDSYGLAHDVQMLKSLNVIDSYKAYFAEGDRYALEGKLADAEAEFTTALSLVDPEESCPVRINLEVVLETQGDLKNADHRRDEATSLWEEALKTVREAPAGCFGTELEQRLLDKLQNPEPGDGGGGGGGQGGEGSGQGDGQGQGAGADGSGQGQGGDAGQGQGQGGDQGQAPGQGEGVGEGGGQGQGQGGGNPGDPAPDTVGADRIAIDSGGSVTHELNPQQGDPDDVLRRLLEDSDASGVDRE